MRRRRSSRASSEISTWKGRISVSTVLLITTSVGTQRPECGPHLGGEKFRLFPGGELAALVDLVEVSEGGERVELRLALAPVVVSRPVAREPLQRELDAVRPIWDELLAG